MAGPWRTEPSSIENWLPWQAHGITPSVPGLTVQPWWVQTEVKALKSPSLGWVTTHFCSEKTAQPPTGMSLVAASAPAAGPSVPRGPAAVVGRRAGRDSTGSVASRGRRCRTRPAEGGRRRLPWHRRSRASVESGSHAASVLTRRKCAGSSWPRSSSATVFLDGLRVPPWPRPRPSWPRPPPSWRPPC